MRSKIGIVALILVVAFLIAIPAIRKAIVKKTLEENRSYEAALYYIHIEAVDSTTLSPIQFSLRWDYEELSPFFKGSGPTVVESLSDGTKIFSLVGVQREAPLSLEVTASGYQTEYIDVDPQGSGILTQDSVHLQQTVHLKPDPGSEETE